MKFPIPMDDRLKASAYDGAARKPSQFDTMITPKRYSFELRW
jgi:hypothetical protein